MLGITPFAALDLNTTPTSPKINRLSITSTSYPSPPPRINPVGRPAPIPIEIPASPKTYKPS